MQKTSCFWNTALILCLGFLFLTFLQAATGLHFIDVADSPPLLSASCERNSLSSWQNRTPTSEEDTAALKLQAFWRGTYVRKVLNSRNPGVSF